MKIKVVTIQDEGDVEVILFANNTMDNIKLLNTMKEKVREWVDEDTEKEQLEVLDHINKITTFKELRECVWNMFSVRFNAAWVEVIK